MNFLLHLHETLLQGKRPVTIKRSNEWATFKKHYEEKYPKVCCGCGTKEKVECHHILPFHKHPEDELKESNVMWLCEGPSECHRRIGHLLDYKGWNPEAKKDAEEFLKKVLANRKRIEGVK